MEFLARAHPDEVTALVLVDPRPADFLTECEARHLDGCGISASTAKSLARVEQEELAAFAGASSQLRAAGPFGRFPVRVLTATSHLELERTAEVVRIILEGVEARDAR